MLVKVGGKGSDVLGQWRRQWAAARVKPGDGRPLKPLRWWQLGFGRSRFHLSLRDEDGREVAYVVDVRHGGEGEDGAVRAHLYRDGRHDAQSRTPAAFPVPRGRIEVAATSFGLKRCHYVGDDGTEQQLTPDPRSAAGRRASLDRKHPTLSRWIGVVSVLLLVVGLGLNLLQVMEPISTIPPVNDVIGTFESPVRLPLWLNIALAAGAALGSTERALRLRFSWLLDSGGN